MKKLLINIIGILLFFQFIVGCIAIQGRLISKVNELPDKTTSIHKPNVFIDVNFFQSAKGENATPIKNQKAKDLLVSRISNIAKESKIFKTYTFNKFHTDDIDYTIKINMFNYGKFTITNAISLFTLTIIPLVAKDNYKLTAIIFDADGKEIKTYTYNDFYKTWFHLFLIPFSFSDSHINVPDQVIDNMLMNLFNDMLNDSCFEK